MGLVNCSKCQLPDTRVTKTFDDGVCVKRARACSCGYKFNSTELSDAALMAITTQGQSLMATNGQPTRKVKEAPWLSTENHLSLTAQPAGGAPSGGLGVCVSSAPSLIPVPPDFSKPPISDDRQSDERGELGVRTVFDHYRVHHPRAFPRPRSESKEWKAILARMREGYALADLCKAIDGYHVSPFHRGENESGTKYLDLALIVRDGTHVAKGIELAAGPGPVVSEKERRNHRAAQGVLERVKQLGLGGGK